MIRFALASEADAAPLAALRTAVAEALTARFGKGHWSSASTERGVLFGMRHAKVVIAREGQEIVGTLRLATKKPWAIDATYFTPCGKPLYLLDMAVRPDRQGEGIGARILEEAERVARAWPADAIRLDAYDAEAGAGEFYRKCGYVERGRVAYRGTPLVYFERTLMDEGPPAPPPRRRGASPRRGSGSD